MLSVFRRKSPQGPPRSNRRRRKAGAWLLLGALLANVFAPLALSSGQAAGTSGGAFFGAEDGVLVICTSNGIEVIRLDGGDGPAPDGSLDDGFCVYCLPLSNGAAVPAAEVAGPAVFGTARPCRPEEARLARHAAASDPGAPRAPPSRV